MKSKDLINKLDEFTKKVYLCYHNTVKFSAGGQEVVNSK